MTGMSDLSLDLLLRQRGGGGEEQGMLRKMQMGKIVINWSQPAVSSMCTLCVFMHVARFCVLYAFCCFLLSRSPAMGNLIKVLGKDLENCPHFFLDFESKWALGCVHVSVCLKCESTCVQRRCSVGGCWEGSGEVYLDVRCWVVDGVMEWCCGWDLSLSDVL